jgi:hypothetical protein
MSTIVGVQFVPPSFTLYPNSTSNTTTITLVTAAFNSSQSNFGVFFVRPFQASLGAESWTYQMTQISFGSLAARHRWIDFPTVFDLVPTESIGDVIVNPSYVSPSLNLTMNTSPTFESITVTPSTLPYVDGITFTPASLKYLAGGNRSQTFVMNVAANVTYMQQTTIIYDISGMDAPSFEVLSMDGTFTVNGAKAKDGSIQHFSYHLLFSVVIIMPFCLS